MNVVTFASQLEQEGKPFHGEWVTDVSKDELLCCYADWEPEVESLLNVRVSFVILVYVLLLFQCIEHPTRWAIHQLKCLPNYVSDRVALLGDAVSSGLLIAPGCHSHMVHMRHMQ